MGDTERRAEDPRIVAIHTRMDELSQMVETTSAGLRKDVAAQIARTTEEAAATRRNLTEQIAKTAGDVVRNTELTQKIEQSTSGLVEAWAAISGGLKVLNFLGKVAKWVTYIAGMITAVAGTWWVIKNGGGPTP